MTTAKKAQSAEGARELAAAVDAADGLKVLSQECQHGLHQIRSATAALPSLIDSLGGKRDNNKKAEDEEEEEEERETIHTTTTATLPCAWVSPPRV